MHSRAVSIKEPRNFDVDAMLTMVVEEQRFRATLPLVIASAWSNGIDVAPIVFSLRVNFGITIYFAGRGLKYPGLHALRKAEHIDRAMNAGFRRLHRVELIVNR